MKAKKIIFAAIMLVCCIAANAQSYRYSRHYDPRSGRLNYSQGGRSHFYTGGYSCSPYSFVGLRIGPSFSTVSSDDPLQDAGSVRTGLNVGLATGFALSHRTPLFFETGIYYTQKGGKQGNLANFNLDYIEVPLTFKYMIMPDRDFSIQPFVGGYLAGGVNGKIKDYNDRISYSVFGDGKHDFQRFDGGLKVGCGISYSMLYAELAYEYGLSDISNDNFDSTHNSSFMLNVGINF